MTTDAIEAGARAVETETKRLAGKLERIIKQMERTGDWRLSEPETRTILDASKMLAAIASGALVPAGHDRTTLHSVISDIREKSGLGGKPMLSELADAIAEKIASGAASQLAAERERCASAAEGPLYNEKYRGQAGHNWWHEKQPGSMHDYGNGRLDAAAAIRALEPASGDCVLVPREPTHEIEMAIASVGCAAQWRSQSYDIARDIYRAMIAAASPNGRAGT